MDRAKVVRDSTTKEIIGYMIQCPACGNCHMFYTKHAIHEWKFSGTLRHPTFAPSMLVHAHDGGQERCHSFVRNGRIQYLNDCTHSMAGSTVDLPQWDE